MKVCFFYVLKCILVFLPPCWMMNASHPTLRYDYDLYTKLKAAFH